jgi:murein DD-endopeptidase MepM/ murein hydrolase activator NlpD
MGYDALGNPTGGKTRSAQLDPNSGAYIPGLATGLGAYSVIGEGPNREKTDTRDSDQGIILGDYLEKRKAILEKYKAEQEAVVTANPEWSTDLTSNERSAWQSDFFERQNAEMDALDLEYPSVADKFRAPEADDLKNANPIEVTMAAQDRLYRLAVEANAHLKPGEFPEGGSREEINAWYQADAAYDLALTTTLQEYMNNTQMASDVVFGAPMYQPPDAGQQQSPTTAQTPATGSTEPVASGTPVPTNESNQWATQMAAAEQEYGLPAGLLQAVAQHESGFNPAAESPVGAMGLMQVMPKTWEEWSVKVGVDDPWNPEQSIAVSAAYLNWLKETLPADKQDVESIMQAYNWGIGNLLSRPTEVPQETRVYAAAISNAVGNTTAGVVPTGTPVPGGVGQTAGGFASPVPEGTRVSQEYGANVEDYAEWNGDHGHEGTDYSVLVGTPVGAAKDGTVEFAGTGNGFDNYGNYIVIDHGDGTHSYYAHLSGFDVEEGDIVTQGQLIGESGNTGRSSGPHLHFSIRKDGDTSGPYGMVDPRGLVGQPVAAAAAAPAVAVGQPDPTGTPTPGVVVKPNTNQASVSGTAPVATGTPQPPATTVGKPNTNTVAQPSGNNWLPGGSTAEQFITNKNESYNAPAYNEMKAGVDAAWDAAYERIAKTYPTHEHLFEEYRGINEEDREAWRAKNPMIKALNFLVYNEQDYATVNKIFGSTAIDQWAQIPPYTGEGDDARSNYYHEKPDAFLTKAWIEGRPEIHDNKDFDPNVEWSWNLGSDYEQAKELFGPDIWDVVKKYYQTPQYVKGEENLAWHAFKEEFPQFDEWRKWWYAKLPNNDTASSGFGNRSFGFNGFDPSQGEHPQYIQGVESRIPEAPQWRNPPSQGSDWRRHLEAARLNIRNPRK